MWEMKDIGPLKGFVIVMVAGLLLIAILWAVTNMKGGVHPSFNYAKVKKGG